MPDFQKFVDGETGTEYTVKDAEVRVEVAELKKTVSKQNDNIGNLQTKMSSFESAKDKIISSALGKALGMTTSTLLADVATKIAAVIDRSSTIQTATTSTANQNASCFRTSGTNIEVIPARGFWNSWDWAKSCIRVTAASLGITSAKIVKGNTILGIAGTDAGYAAGVIAGKTSYSIVPFSVDTSGKLEISTTVTTPAGKTRAIVVAAAMVTNHAMNGGITCTGGGSTINQGTLMNITDANGFCIYYRDCNVSSGNALVIKASNTGSTHRFRLGGYVIFL